MSIGVSKPSFGAVYVSPKGLENLKSEGYWGQEKLEMLQEVAQNKEESVNDFILDDNGNFYIRNEEYGRFRPANPPRVEVSGRNFSCDIWDKDRNTSRFYMTMKDTQSVRELKDGFAPGTSVYGGVVALYNAMNATAAYEKAMQKAQEAKNQQMCDNILSMTQPFTEE